MTGARVTARDVRVTAGATRVLDGVTVTAEPGRVLALMGPSGAGKTTLLRVLHGLRAPDSGDVRVDDAPVPADARARRALLRRFGLAQQKPGFLTGSAVTNVAFPLVAQGVPRREAVTRARAALADVHLTARADAPVATLSGGEAQRVAFARAVVTRPDVLLLDEFTNHLDPVSEDGLEARVLAERARGATVLLVTHRVGQARRLADDVAFLAHGRVTEAGPAARVLDAPESPLVARWLARA